MVAFLCGCPAFPEKRITHAGIAQIGFESLEEASSLVDAFYFEPSRAWALERFDAQRAFYQALAREVGV